MSSGIAVLQQLLGNFSARVPGMRRAYDRLVLPIQQDDEVWPSGNSDKLINRYKKIAIQIHYTMPVNNDINTLS